MSSGRISSQIRSIMVLLFFRAPTFFFWFGVCNMIFLYPLAQISTGYILADNAALCWFYPFSDAISIVVVRSASRILVAYSLFSGEGHLYSYMVLISEVVTPAINMRWYLDRAGMKTSSAYRINDVLIFLGWLVAKILMYVYIYYHAYLHIDQVQEMHLFGYLLIIASPGCMRCDELWPLYMDAEMLERE